MHKKTWILFFVLLCFTFLVACGDTNEETEQDSDDDELKVLEVDFQVPESAEAGETVELKAVVTYGGELVEDADEVEFEYWEQGNEDDSTMVESTNNEDGTYTAEVTFDRDGVYEMYAHTTAKDMHTMPIKEITIGDGTTEQEAAHDNADEQELTEGFSMHFVEPETIEVGEEVDLVVHLKWDEEALENADVRYEVIQGDNTEQTEWADASETDAGEYTATHAFEQADTYTVTVHVENEDGLHEHDSYQLDVSE
ncbi:FixH family protein [Oceanobacillus halotolerans]|uniref:FixH family protein n=1 Tax=Oceanobacillus halotolerans TaxID=2663380 RepID=UPI0013DCA203|nr:FixH family protein [Oceanobacillus halotolerans]